MSIKMSWILPISTLPTALALMTQTQLFTAYCRGRAVRSNLNPKLYVEMSIVEVTLFCGVEN